MKRFYRAPYRTLSAYLHAFFYKNNFIRTASLIFAQNKEQLRTMSLKFERAKNKKGKGKVRN